MINSDKPSPPTSNKKGLPILLFVIVAAFACLLAAGLHATKPKEKAISTLRVDQSGWTVPWAMYADKEGRLWLQGMYTVHPEPGGTVCMLVTKRSDGFVVDISDCDLQWDKWSKNGVGYPVDRAERVVLVQDNSGFSYDEKTADGQAILPSLLDEDTISTKVSSNHFINGTISKMKVGDSGWTLPWGMFQDDKGKLWLNGSYPVESSRGGTVCMLVHRVPDGYIIDTSMVTPDLACWPKGGRYVGRFEAIPVLELRR